MEPGGNPAAGGTGSRTFKEHANPGESRHLSTYQGLLPFWVVVFLLCDHPLARSLNRNPLGARRGDSALRDFACELLPKLRKKRDARCVTKIEPCRLATHLTSQEPAQAVAMSCVTPEARLTGRAKFLWAAILSAPFLGEQERGNGDRAPIGT